jgi:hypothetical protein
MNYLSIMSRARADATNRTHVQDRLADKCAKSQYPCAAARPHAGELRLNAVLVANQGNFVTAGLLTSNALSALLETSCVFRERSCFLLSAGKRQGTLNGLRFRWLHTSGGKEYGS